LEAELPFPEITTHAANCVARNDFQSSFISPNFSAPAHLLSDLQILTMHQSLQDQKSRYIGIAKQLTPCPQFDICTCDSKGQVSPLLPCMLLVTNGLHQLLALLTKGTQRATSTEQAAAGK